MLFYKILQCSVGLELLIWGYSKHWVLFYVWAKNKPKDAMDGSSYVAHSGAQTSNYPLKSTFSN